MSYSTSTHIIITPPKKNPIAIIYQANIFAKSFSVAVEKAITKRKKLNQ